MLIDRIGPGLAGLAAALMIAATAALAVGNEGHRDPATTETAAGWAGDLSPISAADWTYDRAAHLLERAGFGGPPDEIAALAAMTPADAVDRLIDVRKVDNSHVPDFVESKVFDPGMEPFPRSRAEAVAWARERGESMGVKVKAGGDRPYQPVVNKYFYYLYADRLEANRLGQYWAQRMLITARPLEERIALFWHDHFATSNDKVRDYRKMRNQIALFRELGLGRYHDLMIAVAKDPGMLVFLDAGENVKEDPNENFGREVLELFTMGIGTYTETDIREASRAFTGWTNDGLRFVIDRDRHDDGPKTFLGETGNLTGEDIINIALAKDTSARFIAAKLYRYFVNDDADPALLDRLGARLMALDYDIGGFLRMVFLSRDFYSDQAVASQIKSPVQLVVSTYRKLGLTQLPGVPDFQETTDSVGQKLLYPPNVAGWMGGRSWITPSTLVARGNFAHAVLFAPVAEYDEPDRRLNKTDREVGVKIRAGLDITSATVEGAIDKTNMQGDGMAAMSMADMAVALSDEEYNTRYAGYHAWLEAMRRVRPIPRVAAQIDCTGMIAAAGLTTTAEVVDHFIMRLLRVPLTADHRDRLIDFLDRQLGTSEVAAAISYIEEPVRMLLHLIMSTPEYQLS